MPRAPTVLPAVVCTVGCAVICICIVLPGSLHARESEKDGVRIFYRMLGEASNAPLPRKTRTVLLIEGEERTRTTGMANSGFTEYPFCKGRVSYTFAGEFMYYPRIASGLMVDPARTNTADILIPHVFEPDGCVWGPSGREFVQTFIASGPELVSVSLLVSSSPGLFRVELLEGGVGGRPVGDAHAFTAGHSIEWGQAHWRPGEAPLVAGRTYGLRLWRDDGEPWRPYLHATGSGYEGGILHVDGTRRPDCELAVWIVQETADLSRALVPGVDTGGWLAARTEFTFVPRTPNIRLVSLEMSPVPEECVEAILRIRTVGDADASRPPETTRRCVTCGREGQPRSAHFLFGESEVRVTPGVAYLGEVRLRTFRRHEGAVDPERKLSLDLRPRIYGEPHPGKLPCIYNLETRFVTDRTLALSWGTNLACPVTVTLERLSPNDVRTFELEAGQTRLEISDLWPGHDLSLRLRATGPGGLTWKTPVYRLRPPGGPQGPLPPSPYPEHPEDLVRLAPPPDPPAPHPGPIRYLRRVPLTNPGFENGLEGWTATGVVTASGERDGISPPFDRHMAGWTHRAGQRREQVFEESTLSQGIATIPGHIYLVSARVHTSVVNGPRGDTRVRLVADPKGGDDLGHDSSTPWIWTDGRWLRIQHRFGATGERATIGIAFFRWRDLERASAHVDNVLVLDLGARARRPTEGAPRLASAAPRLALADSRAETDERTEVELVAPRGHVITGVGARAAGDNVTTMWLRVQRLGPDGSLGAPEEILGGWEPDAGLEARIELPRGYVATGLGARIAPEWDVKTLALWGRPVLDAAAPGNVDRPTGIRAGTGPVLGAETEFRAGMEPGGGLEKVIRLEAGRVLTSAGLRCSLNDVAGIRGRSARLTPSATLGEERRKR